MSWAMMSGDDGDVGHRHWSSNDILGYEMRQGIKGVEYHVMRSRV